MKLRLFPLVLIGLITSCAYTAPFRKTAAEDGGRMALLMLTAVEQRPGRRTAFFRDTMNVLDNLPEQEGLLGYSFRFQVIGRKAWTMTSWKDETAQDRFVSSPVHRVAVANSRTTVIEMKFYTLPVPANSLPM